MAAKWATNIFITTLYLKTHLLDRVMSLENVRESHLHILHDFKRSSYAIKEIQIVGAGRNLWGHSIQRFSFINNEMEREREMILLAP